LAETTDALEARGRHSLVCGPVAPIEDGAIIRYDRRHETFVKMLEQREEGHRATC
jgi:hypothetical protein